MSHATFYVTRISRCYVPLMACVLYVIYVIKCQMSYDLSSHILYDMACYVMLHIKSSQMQCLTCHFITYNVTCPAMSCHFMYYGVIYLGQDCAIVCHEKATQASKKLLD